MNTSPSPSLTVSGNVAKPYKMTELEQYITSYFGVIHSDQLNKISFLFKLTTLKKNDYFLKTGKHCDKFCFIQTGLLRVFAIPDDKEITQWISTKGYFGTDLSSFFLKPLPDGQFKHWLIRSFTQLQKTTIKKLAT